ncbi:hypothetical protein Tsubulata_044027 [Turnera subulata]|uniref:Protein kinase domain-containing protein n=1 Tax=Turnera subulata TaxID=218843 RepID=A0A516IJC9_9ROSI|nr:hypothetical protein Tsubulata_044027 [Turnera subulata]
MPLLTNSIFPLLLFISAAAAQTNYLLQSDAVSLLSFKSKADLDNKLLYTLNERFDYCQWQGVKCAQGRVVRLVLHSRSLRGTFPPSTLSRLDQLRVLSLHNNSLFGPLPDLSPLSNLKSLFLDRNFFSGSFPPSLLSLHRLTLLDLSHNNLSGPLPPQLNSLDRLSYLKLESNWFNGTVPPLNQTFLVAFDVSGNNLSGPVPVTPTLSRFGAASFQRNADLCGEIINRPCRSRPPFFENNTSSSANATAPFGQSAQAEGGVVVALAPPSSAKHKRTNVVLVFAVVLSVLAAAILCVGAVLINKKRNRTVNVSAPSASPVRLAGAEPAEAVKVDGNAAAAAAAAKTKDIEVGEAVAVRAGSKSGGLVFCGEAQVYTLEQLMRASAELLGRGTMGTTYKALMDNQMIVTVKRLDASKTAVTSSEAFERHMEHVGLLGHPNLVRMAAYFQAKGERLVIYEYQPNGSLFNLIHGSRSVRAKPLHWTSCLKIAEDVAQGLAYIHQASKLVHGNLKSSNVLLGADFEACITDYCLAILADTCASEDPDSAACRAPETRKSSRQATPKSDVYAFGVLLLELLTGKHPSQHPYLVPADMLDWVRAMRDDDGGDDNQLGMLTEVASVCSLTSPEQRPAMWQVLKMIQEIKESILVEG